MRLQVENFAGIKKADILTDGITVIAGENNTGKSTVGKVLFSLFNSMSDIEQKIAYQRMMGIEVACQNTLGRKLGDSVKRMLMYTFLIQCGHRADGDRMGPETESDDVEKIVNIIMKESDDDRTINFKRDDGTADIRQKLVKMIQEVIGIPDEKLVLEAVTRYFQRVFHNQINSLIDPDSLASINLQMQSGEIQISFFRDICTKLNKEVNLTNKAVYIDNPFVIDKLSYIESADETEQFLKRLLSGHPSKDVMDGLVSSVLAKEKLGEVFAMLSSVVPGKIVELQNNEYYLKQENLKEPISFQRLSTGMKSFLIVKMLLEKGCISEKDVVVLDEPEIHLHPEWQVAYAELIVLLQRKFELSLVITTHSPYFLDAINIFSEKYHVRDKVNYYLTCPEEAGVRMENVTGDLERIYRKMASPIQILDTLRYELNDNRFVFFRGTHTYSKEEFEERFVKPMEAQERI